MNAHRPRPRTVLVELTGTVPDSSTSSERPAGRQASRAATSQRAQHVQRNAIVLPL